MNETENCALAVRGLRKTYGSLVAVKSLDLTVKTGEIFGLLGQNGAGKTTAIECILGTRIPDAGKISVLGMDPVRDRKKLFASVGVQFQHSGFQDKLKVSEACETAAALYVHTRSWKELLERFSLEGKKKTCVNELSGGERQKLAVVLALIGEPRLLFLDELTTGLDPLARREMWDYLAGLGKNGVTILLSSHYMDEVEYLCDRVAIMKKGEITVEGKPEDLVADSGAANLEDVFLGEAIR